ncbi:protein ANTAGONIST OF LIKE HETEROCHROMATIN PROTEIN 1-like [Ixodes scapularis]
MKLMRQGDHQFFKKFYRMSPATFDMLHELVQADLQRMHCIREPLASEERLAITLSYLASGQDVKDVALAYRVGLETARLAVHETCRALWARLCPIYMKPPTEAEWVEVGNGFSRRWQFPNCLGAVDGKHVAITCPKDSGSTYYNYKHTFSIVLMAVVDSGYRFVLIDVGAEGRQSDGGVFKASDFGQALENGTLNLPDLGKLPRCQDPRLAPHVFVGDEAFQLRPDFLRPYPAKDLTGEKRVFNYRLSRGRRCAENAFGIMAARWRILLRTINLIPQNVDYVVKATCVLHNYLLEHREHPEGYADKDDCFGNTTEGSWRAETSEASKKLLFSMQPTFSRNFSDEAGAAREVYTHYFSSPPGEVKWQWKLPGVDKGKIQRGLVQKGAMMK